MKKLILKTVSYQALEQAFKSWLIALGYSESTCYNLPTLVREFLHYQEQQKKELKDWQPTDFKAFMEHCKRRTNERRAGALSSNHLNKIAHALDLLQQYLNKINQVDFYYKITRLKSETKVLQIFSKQQIKELYEACDETLMGYRNRVLLGLCYGCGLRRSEAVNLEMSDLWWDKSLLQVRKTKTKKSRLVPMTKQLQADFYYYQQQIRPLLIKEKEPPYFLLSNRGRKLGKQTLYKSFVSLLKTIDLPQTGLHTLRHSIASHLAASGMASEQIAQFLGHQTLDSTQIYVHLKSSNDEDKNLSTKFV
ncbi:tyrosine-type recombinase/integrase [Aureispira sp. CCB-E]|uniref:tyrosine-type recombinase/integrase n=1 Tax=Aureispira sp. CCB-E TaxID=3051121 RepID=UPI0028690627|nr:tyrosine-type recombinase/integrase [Aureispira sp. CCB-E]WMX16231.1 tyrosine-type recombinase/integrase [Aureispira sp. CCB-E]